MSDLVVKVAQADPEVRAHIEALTRGMATLEKRAAIAEKIARDMTLENKRLRDRIAELEGPPPGVWGALSDGGGDV